MINFCPMCGSKVIAGSKFCNGCGLNLTEYQQKLDKLMGTSPIQTKSTNTGNTNKNIIPLKTKNPPVHSELDGNPNFNMQEYILSLDKDYDYLDNIYFNLQREKNQRKISAAYVSQIEGFRLHKGITCTAIISISEALNIPTCVLLAQEACLKYLECLHQTVDYSMKS